MVSNCAHPCSGENIRYHDHENVGVPARRGAAGLRTRTPAGKMPALPGGRPPGDARRSVRAGGGPGDRITSIPPGTASRTDPARGIAGRPGAPGADRGPNHVRKPSPGPTRPVLVRHAPCRRRRPCAPLGQPGTGGRAGGDRALHLPELLLVPAGRSAPRRARRAREPHRSRVSRRLLGRPGLRLRRALEGRLLRPRLHRAAAAVCGADPERRRLHPAGRGRRRGPRRLDRSAAGCCASSNAPPVS